MIHNILVLLLCSGLVAVTAAVHQDVSMNGDVALRLNGSSNCNNATGKAVSLSLESCSQQNCELKKDKSYKGTVSFVPSVTSYNATVSISAAVNTSVGPTILETSTCNITVNRNVTCAFKLKFSKSWTTNGKHSVDVDVMVGKAYQVCQRFPIMLKGSANTIGLSFLLLGALQLILHIKSSA